jgi:hypothetical protein
MGSSDTGSLKVAQAGVCIGGREAAETGKLSPAINCESQPPMTASRLRCRNIWGAVTEDFFVKLSDDVDNLFVEAVNLTNPIRQLAGSGQ